MNKRILISLSVIGAVAAIAIGGTIAYFSDTETSTGNTFTAGSIDLKVDNTSYYNGQPWATTTWQLSDLTGQLFFDFRDLKPGDWGEDTISLHVDNNDSWLCADVVLTSNDDMSSTEPELEAGDQPEDATNTWDGELKDYVKFVWWADDGDNVLETNEKYINSNVSLGTGNVALADSRTNIWGDDGALPGGSTRYIGKAWCFGELILNPVEEGDINDPTVNSGISCDGKNVNNLSQTDSMTADITFRAEQSRNNPNFRCVQPEIIEVTSALMQFGPTGWAGWSCPVDHPNIVGGTTNCSLSLSNSLAWQVGASVDGYNYPTTPFGYTYTSPTEEGWIVQNGGTSQSCNIILNCQAN